MLSWFPDLLTLITACDRCVCSDGSEEVQKRERGRCTDMMHSRSGMTIAVRPSHSYNAGIEHVEFSPTRQTLRAPSAKGGGGSGCSSVEGRTFFF